MKVLLLTHGTRGDIQPFVALARALNISGHETTLAAPSSSASLAKAYNINLVPVHDIWAKLIHDPSIRAALESNYAGFRGKARAINLMIKHRKQMPQVLKGLSSAAEPDHELVVYQPIVPGYDVAGYIGVPAVPACLEPIWMPTDLFPNPIFPYRLPRRLNRTSYQATRWWIRGFVKKRRHWRRASLSTKQNAVRDPFRRSDGTILQAFSRHLLPSSPIYPRRVHTTGYWQLPAPPNWQPPQSLVDFLEAGDAPVYFGFGSMVGRDPSNVERMIAEAIRLAGVRAIVGSGRKPGRDGTGSNDIFYLNDVPFDWLFPRLSAIVHHGGSGTTAAATLAGRPQVVCPFMSMQPFYGSVLHSLGAAPAPLPQRDLTAKGLANTLREALYNRRFASRTQELGEQIRAEGGVSRAVQILERI